MMKFMKKICVYTMVGLMAGLNIQIPTAQASMVGTDQIVKQQSDDQAREKVVAFLERSEVQQQLQSLGVDTADAQERVANLSDSEVQMLAGKIDQLPAGGVIGEVIGAVVFIFLVLLITDLLGLTDVYSFVR